MTKRGDYTEVDVKRFVCYCTHAIIVIYKSCVENRNWSAVPTFPHLIFTIRFVPHCTYINRYVRIEKIPGGELSDCCVIDGVMFNKGKPVPCYGQAS